MLQTLLNSLDSLVSSRVTSVIECSSITSLILIQRTDPNFILWSLLTEVVSIENTFQGPDFVRGYTRTGVIPTVPFMPGFYCTPWYPTGRKKQCCVSRKFDLKAGNYIIVPQAYSHWDTERTIPYTVATFSSKAHTLESRPCRPGFYALALCILAEVKGTSIPSRAHGVKIYRLNDHFLGDLLVVENKSRQHFCVSCLLVCCDLKSFVLI